MNNLVKYLSVASLIATMGAPAQVFADVAKIGIVDTRKVMTTSQSGKNMLEKFQQEFRPREEKILNLEKELKEKAEKMQRNAAIMSDAEKIKIERELVTAQRELQRMQEAFREDSNIRYQEEMQQLNEKVRKAVQEVSEQEKFDVVLMNEASLYHSAEVDITEKVVKKLNQ